MLIKSIKLQRKHIGNNQSLFGWLQVETQNHGTFYYSTIENYERRIKSGTYDIVYTHSPRFNRETLEIVCEGRSGLRIHPANRGCDVTGCVGLGVFNTMDEIPLQVFYSKDSTDSFEAMLRPWRKGIQKYQIEIKDIKDEKQTRRITNQISITEAIGCNY